MAQNFNVETKKKDDKKKAVALVYEPGNEAPQVVASGKGVIAERIITRRRRVMCRSIRTPTLRTLC